MTDLKRTMIKQEIEFQNMITQQTRAAVNAVQSYTPATDDGRDTQAGFTHAALKRDKRARGKIRLLEAILSHADGDIDQNKVYTIAADAKMQALVEMQSLGVLPDWIFDANDLA